MSPILIRPVREQIEHDRIIRVLHARLRKDFDVEANVGDDRRAALRVGQRTHHPDLVLTAPGAPRKVLGVVEVETGESVNHLEAMAEWAHYGKTRAPFHLYVPVSAVDIAKRLVDDYHVSVAQLWSYATVGDHVHFWLVRATGEGAPPPGTQYKLPVDGGYTPPKPEPVPEPLPVPEPPAVPAKTKAELVVKSGKAVAPTPVKAVPKAAAKPVKAGKTAKVLAAPAKAVKMVAAPATPARLGSPAKPSKPAGPHKTASVARSSNAKRPVKKVAPKAAPRRPAKTASKPTAKKGTVKKKTTAQAGRSAKPSKRR